MSPCGRPRLSPNFLDIFPSSKIIHAKRSVPKSVSHLLMIGPNPKNLYTASTNFVETVSKALAMSIARTAPFILFFLQWAIDSQTFIIASCVYLLQLKPFWARLQILFTTEFRRLLITLEISL